eukprot:5182708-Pleurochrysis_carterae.AAC.1
MGRSFDTRTTYLGETRGKSEAWPSGLKPPILVCTTEIFYGTPSPFLRFVYKGIPCFLFGAQSLHLPPFQSLLPVPTDV